jgi:hypothetical protein
MAFCLFNLYPAPLGLADGFQTVTYSNRHDVASIKLPFSQSHQILEQSFGREHAAADFTEMEP